MLIAKNFALGCLLGGVLFSSVSAARAAGILPETSVVIINEADGEGAINVKNTEAEPVLLYSAIEEVEGDNAPLLVINPPVTRVEAGEIQRIRFIMTDTQPLEVQRLRRVVFEGIEPKQNAAKVSVTMNVRQNLPVIIHPKGLKEEEAPWTLLTWSLSGTQLLMENTSPYVVRMAQKVNLMPANIAVSLPRTFILPGQRYSIDLPVAAPSMTRTVRLYPATVYGYTVEHYDAVLNKR